VRRVSDELAVDATYPNGAQRAGPGNVTDGQGGGGEDLEACAVEVRVVALVAEKGNLI